MFGLSEQTRVFLKTGATDGRLGLDALRGLVGFWIMVIVKRD